jgi:hypothetical protein
MPDGVTPKAAAVGQAYELPAAAAPADVQQQSNAAPTAVFDACLQVYPSNYIKTPTGWEDVLQPVSSCSEPDESTVNSAPTLSPNSPDAPADAAVVRVDIIDDGASSYDPPAMPWDVLEAVQLFNSRPQIWYVYMCAMLQTVSCL